VPQQRRRAEINRFKQDPNCRLFLSTDSGSVGLNLQVANAVVAVRLLGVPGPPGHGLNLRNVGPVAEIPEIEELNIGHSIVGRAVLVGFERAVQEMLTAIARKP